MSTWLHFQEHAWSIEMVPRVSSTPCACSIVHNVCWSGCPNPPHHASNRGVNTMRCIACTPPHHHACALHQPLACCIQLLA
ncbi:hypothetical protein HaLaN_16462 [Haematococcus lacustris]|uniref:Uncharacterized protein n=1 Tax=Haematococcus lacustris TaxID=44745 RepID=A0A699ZA26_HAELA|nr:hypothetical protein HaLaN_16462 [Haematococcus lacustris]